MATRLRDELLRSGLADVHMDAANTPAEAKGAGLEWATLGVTLIGTLPPLIALVHSWVRRQPGASVTVEIDGDAITLSDATPAERRRLLNAWLRRHGGD